MDRPLSIAEIGTFDDHADVIILGYGIAGACAALEARGLGGDVLVLERAGGGGRAEVLGDKGDTIKGLYAAGACTAHLSPDGKSYASGMSLGPGSYFGRMAGRSAMGSAAA